MQTSLSQKLPSGDAMRAASRQVWLASLGAAVVTREWAGKEAGQVLRTLVRQGTAVESRALRFVGDRVESSVVRANALLRQARSTLNAAVRTYADGAVTLVRDTLPRALPKVELPSMLRPAAAAKRHAAGTRRVKTVKARKSAKAATGTTRRTAAGGAKRGAKRVAKRTSKR